MSKLKGQNVTARLYQGGKELREYNIQSVSVKHLGTSEMEGRCGTKNLYLDYTYGGWEVSIEFNREIPKAVEELVDSIINCEKNNLPYPLIGVAIIYSARGTTNPGASYLYSPGLFDHEASTGGPNDALKDRIRFIATDRKAV